MAVELDFQSAGCDSMYYTIGEVQDLAQSAGNGYRWLNYVNFVRRIIPGARA